MRIIVPYIPPADPAVLAPLRCYNAETVDVSASDESYFELLRDVWAAGETFCVVEHDIVVKPHTIPSLEGCPADWCGAPYPYFHGPYAGLGCTKFTEAIIARNPTLWDTVAEMSNSGHPRKHWCTLDAWSQITLTRAGEAMCHDHYLVNHLGPLRPSHGCHD